jgi:hypothetical protein
VTVATALINRAMQVGGQRNGRRTKRGLTDSIPSRRWARTIGMMVPSLLGLISEHGRADTACSVADSPNGVMQKRDARPRLRRG